MLINFTTTAHPALFIAATGQLNIDISQTRQIKDVHVYLFFS